MSELVVFKFDTETGAKEMEDAISNKPLGLTRAPEVFEELLEQWRITR